jgi:1,5-anhydro-D-fructose reductase (1,5-anhydro-D-mannitol-forming)
MQTIQCGQTIRWGILGCGDVAEKKGGPALYQATGSELTAVMRRDKAKAIDFAQRHGARRAYDSVKDLLADAEIDAIYIATPPHLHCEQTLLCAEAGKHVLCEKPMALNSEECETMVAACKQAGVFLHIAYYRRFWPKFVALKAALDAGKIGTILGARLLMTSKAAHTGWRVDPAISGGGHVVDVGSHRLDMLAHLLGDIDTVQGFSANLLKHHAAENDTVLSIHFTSGVVASAAFHFHTQPSQDILEIYGSHGTAVCNPFDGNTLKIGDHETTYTQPTPTHLPFIESLLCIYRGEQIPHVTGVDGAKATRILDAVLR